MTYTTEGKPQARLNLCTEYLSVKISIDRSDTKDKVQTAFSPLSVTRSALVEQPSTHTKTYSNILAQT